MNEEDQRKQSIYCYLIAIVLFLATEDYDCTDLGRPSQYRVSYKYWIVVYMAITICQLGKHYVIERLQDSNQITYSQRHLAKRFLSCFV